MIRVLSFLTFLVVQVVNAQQLCVPEDVGNVTLELDYTLHWSPSTNCAETHYLIYIHIEDDLQVIYTVEEPALNVSFLPACERFYFEVRAFSNNELSEASRLTAYIPAPSGADLTIDSFTVSVQDANATFLNWRVTEKFAHCARGFRVVIRDSVSQFPRDIYTDRNNIFLNDLIPCGRYEFSVMAIYNVQSEGPIDRITHTAPQEVAPLPVLQRVITGDTYVNITWTMPPYSVNRCRIRSIDVEGLPFLHREFAVDDSTARPPFMTSIDSLQPDNMYMLRVAILNSAGTSQTFPIGVQTEPQLKK